MTRDTLIKLDKRQDNKITTFGQMKADGISKPRGVFLRCQMSYFTNNFYTWTVNIKSSFED